jgi:hypothetical protein
MMRVANGYRFHDNLVRFSETEALRHGHAETVVEAGAGADALAEDVVEATLVDGKATVALDKAFADLAGGDYRVFLTELAGLGGLYVVR